MSTTAIYFMRARIFSQTPSCPLVSSEFYYQNISGFPLMALLSTFLTEPVCLLNTHVPPTTPELLCPLSSFRTRLQACSYHPPTLLQRSWNRCRERSDRKIWMRLARVIHKQVSNRASSPGNFGDVPKTWIFRIQIYLLHWPEHFVRAKLITS